jgi:hypothetical protein
VSQWWSWVLGVWGLLGFVLAGQRVWWAWWVNLACQGAWFAYACVSEQWGFLVATVGYTVVFWRNAVKWTRERERERGSVEV